MLVMPAALRRVLRVAGELFGGDGDDFGMPAEALGEGGVDVAAGGEGDDLIAVGEGLADGEGASCRWSRWSRGLLVSSQNYFRRLEDGGEGRDVISSSLRKVWTFSLCSLVFEGRHGHYGALTTM